MREKPGLEIAVDPDDQVSLLQKTHVRRAQGKMMRGYAFA